MPQARQGVEPESLSKAFASFEDSLRAILTAEAEKSVADAIERLSASGTFQITDISVDVTIDQLKVAAGTPSQTTAAPKRRPRRGGPKPKGRGGRPPGAVRSALLAAFDSGEKELSAEELRQYLSTQGVEASVDNLHQHLGRLVKAGELSRPGRGRYRRRS